MPDLNEFDVFISYASADTATAQRFADALSKSGLRPWVDSRELRMGEKWSEEISKALGDSRACVVLLDQTSSSNQRFASLEWQAILEKCWEQPDFAVIPVTLDPTSSVPAFLQRWQTLKVSKNDKDFSAAAQIVASSIARDPHERLQDIDATGVDSAIKRFEAFIDEVVDAAAIKRDYDLITIDNPESLDDGVEENTGDLTPDEKPHLKWDPLSDKRLGNDKFDIDWHPRPNTPPRDGQRDEHP